MSDLAPKLREAEAKPPLSASEAGHPARFTPQILDAIEPVIAELALPVVVGTV